MSVTEAPPIIAQSGLLVQCGWCSAIKLDGTYQRCPAIPLMNTASDNVSHGICPECVSNLRVDLGRMLD